MSYTNLREAAAKIANEEPFTGNSLSAEKGDFSGNTVALRGRLFGDRGDILRGHRLRYVVVSYDTPIAAVTARGEAIHVPGKFSPTTSHHQQVALYGLRSHRQLPASVWDDDDGS